MELVSLCAENYRSLRRESVDIGRFTLFIGTNASGKSTILEALRFLGEAMRPFSDVSRWTASSSPLVNTQVAVQEG